MTFKNNFLRNLDTGTTAARVFQFPVHLARTDLQFYVAEVLVSGNEEVLISGFDFNTRPPTYQSIYLNLRTGEVCPIPLDRPARDTSLVSRV